MFVSVRDADKPRVLDAVQLLASLGFKVIATSGTQRFLTENGVEATRVNKVRKAARTSSTPSKTAEVQLVFNTTEGAHALADSRSLRRAALLHKVPYYTTLSGAVAAAQGIKAYLGGDLEVRALQSYFSGGLNRPVPGRHKTEQLPRRRSCRSGRTRERRDRVELRVRADLEPACGRDRPAGWRMTKW